MSGSGGGRLWRRILQCQKRSRVFDLGKEERSVAHQAWAPRIGLFGKDPRSPGDRLAAPKHPCSLLRAAGTGPRMRIPEGRGKKGVLKFAEAPLVRPQGGAPIESIDQPVDDQLALDHGDGPEHARIVGRQEIHQGKEQESGIDRVGIVALAKGVSFLAPAPGEHLLANAFAGFLPEVGRFLVQETGVRRDQGRRAPVADRPMLFDERPRHKGGILRSRKIAHRFGITLASPFRFMWAGDHLVLRREMATSPRAAAVKKPPADRSPISSGCKPRG